MRKRIIKKSDKQHFFDWKGSFIFWAAAIAFCGMLVMLVAVMPFAVRYYGESANRRHNIELCNELRSGYIELGREAQRIAGEPEVQGALAGNVTPDALKKVMQTRVPDDQYLLVRQDGQVIASNLPVADQIAAPNEQMRACMESIDVAGGTATLSFSPLYGREGTAGFFTCVVEASTGERGYLFLAIMCEQLDRLLETAGSSEVILASENRSVYATVYNPQRLLDELQGLASGSIIDYRGSQYVVNSGMVVRKLKVYTLRSLTDTIAATRMIGFAGIGVSALFATLFTVSGCLRRRRECLEKKQQDYISEQCQKMDLDFRIPINGREENKALYGIINHVMEQVHELVAKNEELMQRRTHMEVKHLQGQFNPHFVFNLLANLQYMIRVDPLKASTVVAGLSKLLRYSIENGRTRVPLHTDIKYMENYLMLQKSRFGARLDYSIDIDPILSECKIPKLLFQPLVENSIMHNIDEIEHLKIELTARHAEEGIVFCIQDNGRGIPPQELYQLQELLHSAGDNSNHIGLYNVHRTIQLEYGEMYGLELHSVYTRGTIITVTLPFEEGKENG